MRWPVMAVYTVHDPPFQFFPFRDLDVFFDELLFCAIRAFHPDPGNLRPFCIS